MDISGWTGHTAVQVDAVNKVAILVQGTGITYFINDINLGTITDYFNDDGSLGVAIDVPDGDNSIIDFSTFTLYTP